VRDAVWCMLLLAGVAHAPRQTAPLEWRRADSRCHSMTEGGHFSAPFSARTQAELSTRGASQVWQEVTALARQPGIIDLGQGWPDFGADETAKESAAAAILDGAAARNNQYSAADGVPELKAAVSEYYNALYGWSVTPQEVLITTSATEALYCATQAYLDAGDEVICFEPVFPWYVAHCRLAGATVRTVRLAAPHYAIDVDALAAAFSPRTKMVIFNSPHNPTGHVATAEEVAGIARLCIAHNVLVLADEVYERKSFVRPETRLRDAPGMAERTITLGTSSKLLSVTGWRVAWAIGPSALLKGVASAHSYASFCAPTPLQMGVAAALRLHAQGGRVGGEADASAAVFARNARALASALIDVGLAVHPVDGGYFLVADVAATGLDAGSYCKALIACASVAAVPMDVFYVSTQPPPPTTLVRFAICKQESTIDAACAAIRGHPLPLVRA
jgi:aspartate/methionine/tyrosine aminotransferase